MSEKNAQFKANPDGPLEITGNFIILDSRGREVNLKGPVFLCRCGGSSNKPFCDDTHLKNGFRG